MNVIRTVNVTFSEDEHRKLMRAKGAKTWRDWMLDIAEMRL